MSERSRFPTIFFLLLLLVTALMLLITAGVEAGNGQVSLANYELIGTVNIPTGTQFEGTEVGGLSSITYDAKRGIYYTISDDPSAINPARYYTIAIDLSDGQLDPDDITFLDVTTLLDSEGNPYPAGSVDPEGLVLARHGALYWSSEGFTGADPPIDPFINRINLEGRQNRALVIPEKFLPNVGNTQGVRNNLAFESLNVDLSKRHIITAVEGALVQDGPASNVDQESFARILAYDHRTGQPGSEYVYVVDPVPDVPEPPTAFRVNGLVELLPMDNVGTMLAMERGFSVGRGNTVIIYEIQTAAATDVSAAFSLFPNGDNNPPIPFDPVTKTFILDVEDDLGIVPDNLEGMAFGPPLPDGRLPLILVSDNNFSDIQTTQFIALAVELVVDVNN